MERKQRAQGSEIVDRRRWLGHFLHDLQGQVAALNVNVDYFAKLAPPTGDVRLANFLESIEDVRTVFAQLMANVRTVQDYDRYENSQLVPQETSLALGDVAADVADELRRQAGAAERPFSFARPPADTERKIQGDRELLRRAMSNLGFSALRRAPARAEVAMSVTETDGAARFRVTIPGEGLQGADRLNAFEPY